MLVHRGWLALWPSYVPHRDAVILKQLPCRLARKRRRIGLRRRGVCAEASAKSESSFAAVLFVIDAIQSLTLGYWLSGLVYSERRSFDPVS